MLGERLGYGEKCAFSLQPFLKSAPPVRRAGRSTREGKKTPSLGRQKDTSGGQTKKRVAHETLAATPGNSNVEKEGSPPLELSAS